MIEQKPSVAGSLVGREDIEDFKVEIEGTAVDGGGEKKSEMRELDCEGRKRQAARVSGKGLAMKEKINDGRR